jgi:folate-binding protein YgfZ
MNLFVARLKSRALVRVSGPDRLGFLQGLLTQETETLGPGDLRFGALLTPQGKLLFDLFVLGGEAVLLDAAADRREALIQRLSLYKLRAAVEFAPADGGVWAAWTPEAGAWIPPWIADPRLPTLGARAYGDAPAPETASEADYHAWRLTLGVPDPARDAADGGAFPIEADFDLLNGIDFRKGCFVGQETTSRMKRRGQIKTRTLPIVFDGPPPSPGAEILAGDLRAGEVLSGMAGRAMARIRLDRAAGADLSVDGRPVRVEYPGWFPRD